MPRLLSLGLSLVLAPVASAQLVDDTFEVGSNLDAWIAWDAQYCAVESTGGHPAQQLTLDNLSGPTACQFVEVRASGAAPFAHSGDWRAADVRQAAIDLNVRRGRYGGELRIVLVSDPSTPSDPSDDCTLSLVHPDPSPGGIGWTRYSFSIPASEPIAPPGWVAGGACASTPVDQVWNAVLQDVDEMRFVLDTIPGASCVATRWDLGIDNVSVRTGALGSVYCLSRANSTGGRARLTGIGSRVAANEDVTLAVSSLPADSFGYFLMSELTAVIPVHEGDLCLGGEVKRFSMDVIRSGPEGLVQFSPDFNALPMGSVFRPGDTWNFQYWYRDVGPTTNFSEGLSVVFE